MVPYQRVQNANIPRDRSMMAIETKTGPAFPVTWSAVLSIHLKHRNTIRDAHIFVVSNGGGGTRQVSTSFVWNLIPLHHVIRPDSLTSALALPDWVVHTNGTTQTREPQNPGLEGNFRLVFLVIHKGEKPFRWASCSLEGNALRSSANAHVMHNVSFECASNKPSITARSHCYLYHRLQDQWTAVYLASNSVNRLLAQRYPRYFAGQ